MTAACGAVIYASKMIHIMHLFVCERGYTCITDSSNKFDVFSLLLSRHLKKKLCLFPFFEMQVQDGHLF